MTPTLSCSIMAHPKRETMVAELVEQLDRPAEVVWDRINDRHDTGGRAMAAFNPDCSHHLVVQDDVLPCRDLIAGAERALKWLPQDVPVSLYVGKVKPFRRAVEIAVAKTTDETSWVTMSGVYWGPAVIVPTVHIGPMLEWYETAKVVNYDRRMSHWFQDQGLRCWYSWPSLVDHRGDESLVKGHGAGRHAHRFIGEDVSALSVDWSGGVVEMQGTGRLDLQRQMAAGRARA